MYKINKFNNNNEFFLKIKDNDKNSNKKRLFLFSFLILIIIILKISNSKYIIKVCVCTLGKLENKYVREFVQFYKKLGIDKIILYDNNDIDGEKFDSVISDYINSEFVEIKNYRGKDSIQLNSINDCINQYRKQYDWFLIIDMDEFLHIKEGKIKKFLSLDRLKNCSIININWRHHSDGGHIYYKNESLFKRFPDIVYRYPETVKSMIRRPKEPIKIDNHHILRTKNSCYNSCLANGTKILENDFINGIQINNPDYKDYYIDHFYTKSTEEYIEKKSKGDCYFGKYQTIDLYALDIYFWFNKITLEKIEFFEEKTGYYLSQFRKELKNL